MNDLINILKELNMSENDLDFNRLIYVEDLITSGEISAAREYLEELKESA